ncbi:LysR family transcriptional regulator [Roseovarius sp. LXJ103]|uniref:LysR family transcriptional regulator n=1 Tax=Roseovarius carneus TaxID=2853164 RepID=UPI000D609B7A|nr:LysR family transcriptional regulator [Roseovarius carneus]MBZ8117383.1 LysR family transcriptional regulator [Roseovarius carneus]PWE36800.1 LysR family transcriptional regulator [Pelagicola sp. LXJ1103]
MNPTFLKSFVALAELGSFQAAAARIDIAQSTLSQHIKKLEEALGAPLIQRSHSGSRLTDAGLRLLPHAQQVLTSTQRAQAAVLSESLKIGCSGNIASYFMPDALASFLKQTSSQMQWEVIAAPNPRVAQMLLAGEIDIAAMEWPISHPAVTVAPWISDEMIVILPPNHPFAARDAITFAELKTLRILGGERGSGTGTLLTEALGPQAEDLDTIGNVGSTEAVKRGVAAGLGASIVLETAVRSEIASGSLAIARLEGMHLEKQLFIAQVTSKAQNGPAARLFKFLLERD